MYAGEESHCGIVPMNSSNKDGRSLAEKGEGRPRNKENTCLPNTLPTQSGARVSQGLAGVRRVAQEQPGTKFTALLHHLTVDLLRESFYALKRILIVPTEKFARSLCEVGRKKAIAKGHHSYGNAESPRNGRNVVAHGASRGRISPPTQSEPRWGRKDSHPNVSLIVGNAILLKKSNEFLLEGHAAVVLLLLANIPHDRGCEGMTDAERSIAGLPVESGKTPATVEPTRRIGLYHPQGVGRRHRGRQGAEEVHVVRSGVCGPEGAAEFAHHSAQVAEKIVLECRSNQWRTVFGAENHVGQQVGVRVGHILSPLRGLREILPDSFTHRLRSGLRPSAR